MPHARLLAALLLALTAAPALAADEDLTARFADLLRRSYPGAKELEVAWVCPTSVEGLYEVGVRQPALRVIYWLPAKDWVLAGELLALPEGRSLTSAALDAGKADHWLHQVARLPLEDAIRIGDGPHKVIEFTDPDCPYCRKAQRFLQGRTDLTRYVFLAPLAHPGAAGKVAYILASDDRGEALESAMDGDLDTQEAQEALAGFSPSPEVKALAARHLELARTLGINGTPWFHVDGATAVLGANQAAFEEALALGAEGRRQVAPAAPPPQAAEPEKKAAIVYPREIENCEPCKRLWLANNQKPKKAKKYRAAPKAEGDAAPKAEGEAPGK